MEFKSEEEYNRVAKKAVQILLYVAETKSPLLRKLKAKNFDIVEELIYKVCQNQPNIRIKEVPFLFKKRMFGKTKRNLFLFIFTFTFTIFKLRFFI